MCENFEDGVSITSGGFGKELLLEKNLYTLWKNFVENLEKF